MHRGVESAVGDRAANSICKQTRHRSTCDEVYGSNHCMGSQETTL